MRWEDYNAFWVYSSLGRGGSGLLKRTAAAFVLIDVWNPRETSFRKVGSPAFPCLPNTIQLPLHQRDGLYEQKSLNEKIGTPSLLPSSQNVGVGKYSCFCIYFLIHSCPPQIQYQMCDMNLSLCKIHLFLRVVVTSAERIRHARNRKFHVPLTLLSPSRPPLARLGSRNYHLPQLQLACELYM